MKTKNTIDPENETTDDELFDRWAETFDSDSASDSDYWDYQESLKD
jgi:hypothetical protein